DDDLESPRVCGVVRTKPSLHLAPDLAPTGLGQSRVGMRQHSDACFNRFPVVRERLEYRRTSFFAHRNVVETSSVKQVRQLDRIGQRKRAIEVDSLVTESTRQR